MNLIKKVEAVENVSNTNVETENKKFSSCFDGIGLLKIKPIKISVKEDVMPVMHAPRKFPYDSKWIKKLDKFEKKKIIKNVVEPTEWVNSLVIVWKSNWKYALNLSI